MSSGVWFPTLGLVAWLCCLSLGPVQGGKILVLPVDGSHWLSMKILVKELSRRGHDVLVMVPECSLLMKGSDSYKTEIYKVPYTKDDLDGSFKRLKDSLFIKPPSITDLFVNVERLVNFTSMQVKGCESLLNNHPLMTRLREEGFDLLLTDPFLPCGSVLAHMFSIPAVYFLRGLPFDLDSKASQRPSPLSYVPLAFTGNTDIMTFPQRVKNMVMFFVESYMCKVVYSHFDDLDLEEFVDGSGDDGFIVFTLGSMVSIMPEEKAQHFFDAFRQIPQRVVWRYTGVPPVDAPKNVKLMKWLPQNDLLAHPKAKVFITHGGTHGVYEGICNAVPMLMFPLFGDQGDNVHRMVSRGVAEKLEIYDVTAEKVVTALNNLIHDKSYKEKIVKMSAIHLDRPVEPLDLAVFWTEFIIKHKGAKHLRIAAHELNWIQYHSLDVIGFLVIILLTVLFVTFKCCLFCTRKCFRKGTSKKKKE
ncbi:UDP-glucuronosyltransferase 1-1 [Collichthys lucidus]|uniref:UDP-glucuronosyltransferase n=1 Tax=Collichthys lucidus TaxID=240159 RepID=A0A4U5U0R6_COLLU|nr:UDP-glucuronosyltransferase 1-1 [Collichthys lucidus]